MEDSTIIRFQATPIPKTDTQLACLNLATSADIALTDGIVSIGESGAVAGAIAHWTFDEADGATTLADSTGTYNGHIMGTGTTSFFEDGQVGDAMHFDGNVYIDLPD